MSPSLRVGRVGALQAIAAVVIAVAMVPHVAATPPLVAKMPHFTIDMDDSPSERWSTAVGSLVAMHGWEHTYGGFFATIAKAIAPMPDSVFSMMEYSLSKHPEMFEELMGVQAAFMSLGHNVSKNILMTGSFVYAFQHLEPSTSEVTNLRGASDAWEATMGNMPQARGACSSIIAQNEDGTIIHGRNNDAGQTFRNITAQITWIKGSTVVLKTVQYVGFIGSWTSVRPGIASLSQDTRMYQGYSMSYILENIVQSAPTDWILRDSIMHAANFSALVSTLSEVHLPAPSYFIVGGVQPGEGVIITRNFSTCAPLLRLADKAGIPPQPHSKVAAWAIVETNWDYWKKDPAADPRRIQELAHLAEYGQSYGATLMGLHQVLTTPGQPRGALNTATLYNAMMCAANATLIPRLECYDGCAG